MDGIEGLDGVGPATAEALRGSGYGSIESIANATAHELAESASLGRHTATKIISSARESTPDMGYERATEVMKRRKNVGYITTGSENFDSMLRGGVETQAIVEVYGEFSSGKTQLAHQLSVNVQLPDDEGGLGGGAIYIDTENTFRPERIFQMAEALSADPELILENIYVARACTTDHQMLLTEKASEMAEEDGARLLVVDGLMSLFRTEFVGRGGLAERQQKLGKHLATLQKLTEKRNMAVLVTNHVQARPDVFFGDPTRPIGGHVLGHAATCRIYIRKSKKNSRKAQLIDHPSLPPRKVVFKVTEEGIRD